MKEISLTQEQVTKVDDWNYDWLMTWKWFAQKSRGKYYAARHSTKEDGTKYYKRKIIFMHNVIMKPPIGKEIDHENSNGLDNQEHNLHIRTHLENMANYKKRNGKSKYFGVSISKSGQICAYIRVRGVRKYLGSFKTEIEAAKKYNKAVIEYNTFSKLNNL